MNQVHCEGKASSIAHLSIMYFYPILDDGPMNERYISYRKNNKRTCSVLVFCWCGL